MKSLLIHIAFWADLGFQGLLLIICLLGVAAGVYAVSLTALLTLGLWQLSSALIVGLLLKDHVRIIYFLAATGVVCLGFGFMVLMDESRVGYFLAILGLTIFYISGWIYMYLQWSRRFTLR